MAALIADELEAKCDGLLVAMRTHAHMPGTIELQEWVRAMRDEPVKAERLLARCAAIPAHLEPVLFAPAQNGRERPTAGLLREFLAYCLFCATMLQFFDTARPPEEFQDALEGRTKTADRLAEARQAFGINSHAAWASLNAFRDEVPRMDPVPYPAAQSGPAEPPKR